MIKTISKSAKRRSAEKSQWISSALCVLLALSQFGLLTACGTGKSELAAAPSFDAEVAQSTYSEPPVPAEPERALISFAGDCTFSSIQGYTVFNDYYDSEGPGYFFSGVQEAFANDDLTVVNLEGPLTTSTDQIGKEGTPNFWFKSPPEYVNILSEGSVEAVNFANNHCLDYGRAGYDETIATVEGAGITRFGYNDSVVVDVNGIKIGFFGFAFDSDTTNIQVIMDELWGKGAEVIVAYFHDGIELDYTPSGSQVNAAYAAIDYGASAVIMSHPHVVQGTETYNGGFIAYSLGNFCFGGNGNPNDKDSMIVQLQFVREGGEITCTPCVIPCSISSSSNTNDYRPVILDGDEGQRVMDKIAQYSR